MEREKELEKEKDLENAKAGPQTVCGEIPAGKGRRVFVIAPMPDRRSQTRAYLTQRGLADVAKALFRHRGWDAWSPWDVFTRGCEPGSAEAWALYLRTALTCEAAYFLKGWEQCPFCLMVHDAVTRLKSFSGRDCRCPDVKVMYEP